MKGNKAHIRQGGNNDNGKAIVVRNRDIPLLADILYIMQEVCAIEQRRDWQKERMYNITQHLTGMPGRSGGATGLDEAFALLSEIDEEHEERCKEYVQQLKEAQRILNDIESRSMRSFVVMKYVMGMQDTEIRQELNLTRRAFEKAKRSIEDADCIANVRWQERYILTKYQEKAKMC